ncbi:hypothetical protein [Streptomyces sp.]|uniref:hypothetical protein n=1 Tax=Streptomyces sp. TaxID=1931 RepID=UPI002811D0C2|nr:hypothetical protein [Streptomyces sp.]
MSLAPALSPAHLLDTPLPDLLAETGVEVYPSSIDDRGFFGAVVQRKSGEIVLTMPIGRSELEHDTMARYLLAQVFDVDVPAMPAPIVTTKF